MPPHLRGILVGLLTFSGVVGVGCERDEQPQNETFYERRIAPTLTGSCLGSPSQSECHAAADDRGNALGNLNLESYDTLSLRRDLLINYGPYGYPALLLKVLPPYQVRITSWDDSEPKLITTDIAHGGKSIFDFTSQSLATLSQWIERGAAENNAAPQVQNYDLSPCSKDVGRDDLFDAGADPPTPDYAEFVDKVNPILNLSCAAGNCHGSPANSLYLTCGETNEQKRWNYFAAGDYVAFNTQDSEILRRGLDPSQGGTFHEGGTIFQRVDDPDYRRIESWAAAKGGPTNIPSDPGFSFFEDRVQPMLVKRGCMQLGCHSPTMFHDYRLRGGSGGHFGLPASRTNYELSLEQLALEGPNVNSSRLVRKNLLLDRGGIRHRGGALFGSAGDPAACDAQAAMDGPLDEQEPYCIISAWFDLEKANRMANAEPLSAIVYVRRPPSGNTDHPQDWADFRAGSEVVSVAASLASDGTITLGAETSLSTACGLDPATSEARRPAVSWDGTRVAFSARSAAGEPFRIYVVEAGACTVEATIDTAPVLDNGDGYSANGELVHNFDPTFTPDGRIVFVSTRGNIDNVDAFDYSGPQRTPADPSKLNTNLYVAEDGSVRQLTFLLNQELTPSMMRDGRVILVAEKRATDFYQLAGRRINLDGGDYHPLFGQRNTIGFNQFTDVVELSDKNLAAILSERGAAHGAGTLAIINRSIGVDQRSTNPEDYLQDPGALDWPNQDFYQHSILVTDARATGLLASTQGAYRNPSPLPDGRVLVSYAAGVTNLGNFSDAFDVVVVDPSSGARTSLISTGQDLVWPVAVYARPNQGVFSSRPDEANGNTRVFTDDRQDRSQITFLDLPLLASLLFQNTRSQRIIPGPGLVEIWENLPPEPGVKSYGDGGNFVDSDAYGQYYLRRRLLGTPQIYDDGSARVLVRGGTPLSLAVSVQLADDSSPTLHFQKEEMQFYPGEFARQSFKREFFNGLCGGCHGAVNGLESNVAANPDILTRASEVVARSRNPDDLRTPGDEMSPPFP